MMRQDITPSITCTSEFLDSISFSGRCTLSFEGFNSNTCLDSSWWRRRSHRNGTMSCMQPMSKPRQQQTAAQSPPTPRSPTVSMTKVSIPTLRMSKQPTLRASQKHLSQDSPASPPPLARCRSTQRSHQSSPSSPPAVSAPHFGEHSSKPPSSPHSMQFCPSSSKTYSAGHPPAQDSSSSTSSYLASSHLIRLASRQTRTALVH